MTGRISLATLTALLLAGPAAAGPIEWDYTAHVRTSTGLGVLNLGTFRLLSDPSGNGTAEPVAGDYTITAPLPEATVSGTYPAYPGQPNDEVRLFSVGDGWRVYPAEAAPVSDPRFHLTFVLTDRASGQSGTVEFDGTAGVSTGNEFPPSVLFSASMGPPVTDLRLGGNLYRVTVVGGMPVDIEAPAVVGVKVEAGPAAPEPGSLALAGLGLGAAGLVRPFRRRGSSRRAGGTPA